MTYLVRFRRGTPHPIAHYVYQIGGKSGALCSRLPRPAAGDETLNGRWELRDTLPSDVRVCLRCRRKKQRLDNPLPERVEQELQKLALWDERAAALQRKKMLAYYRQKQLQQ